MDCKTYDVLLISRLVVNMCHEKGISISNLKLQKLLYYIQATFLAVRGIECFEDEIEAWCFGPVVPKAYQTFKIYGSNEIPFIKDYIDFNSKSDTFLKRVPFNEEDILERDRDYISQVIDYFGKYTAPELVKRTHNETPWKTNYKGKYYNNIIPKKHIEEYFKERITLIED